VNKICLKFSPCFQFRSAKLSIPKWKRNLLDFKQKHEIIDYAMKHPKRTQQQITDYFSIFLEFEFEFLVFNATFSNISAISWRPVLVVEEAGVPGENHRPWASNW